jgi:hypothetical protein
VCTPIFLEWEDVHSNIFGADTFPLQNFSLPWSQQSYTQSSLQKFGVHLKSTPKVLECTSSPLQKFWIALKVHSKKNRVHSVSTPKKFEYTTFHSKNGQNFGVHNCPLQFFWCGRLFTPFFWSGHLPTPKCWSACSKSLECI